MKTVRFNVSGMTCAACQANVTKVVERLNGVDTVNVNLPAASMTVIFDESRTNENEICKAVNKIGYGASVLKNAAQTLKQRRETQKQTEQKEAAGAKRRLIASLCLLIPLVCIKMAPMTGLPFASRISPLFSAYSQFVLATVILIIQRRFFQKGFKALVKRVPNMDSLVAMGSGTAYLYSVYSILYALFTSHGGSTEVIEQLPQKLFLESAAMIVTLVSIGKYAESRSKARTGDALDGLINLSPATARVWQNGEEVLIPTEDISVSDTVIIKPGDTVPVDGTVLSGSGSINQSAVTGESIPVEVTPGSKVISATRNENGSFHMRAEQVGENTTLAKIIQTVEEASTSKAPIARLADSVSGIFVPTVFGIALLTAIVWLLVGESPAFALNCAISVLVISCPCALGLATPLAIMVGTGKAAQLGILVKSAEALETLHRADTVVMDKTGTLTCGTPAVTDIKILRPGLSQREFIAIAASAEQNSEHPLAKAVVSFAKNIPLPPSTDFTAVPGKGIHAVINQKCIVAGSVPYLTDMCQTDIFEIEAKAFSEQGKTVLCFAGDGQPMGIIAMADTLRDTAKETVDYFKKNGLEPVLLTGDNEATARAIAAQLEITNVLAQVMPDEKAAAIRSLQAKGKTAVMIGDGINDAPALVQADIGIAVGSGTDIAIDSADLILSRSRLTDCANAVALSRAVIKNIKQNLFWAFFYNIIGIPVAAGVLYPAFGVLLNPIMGAAAMSISSVFVVTNALRLRRFQAPFPYNSEKLKEEINNTAEQKGEETMKKTIYIEGMMCEHCKMHVEKALAALDGVSDYIVDLAANTATVTLAEAISDDTLTAAITDAGYTVTKIEG